MSPQQQNNILASFSFFFDQNLGKLNFILLSTLKIPFQADLLLLLTQLVLE